MVYKIYFSVARVNPQSTEIFNFNFQSLAVVPRYRDPQLQVTENLFDLRNLIPDIYQCFKISSIFYCYQLIIAGASKITECLL